MKRAKLLNILILLTSVVMLVVNDGVAGQEREPAQHSLRTRVEQLRSGQELMIEGTSIAAVQLIPELYTRREFKLAWNKPENISALLRLVVRSYDEGLDPADYHLQELQNLTRRIDSSGGADPALKADLDILLTDSLVRLVYHIRFGKTNPKDLDANWNLTRKLQGRDPVTIVQAAIASDSLEQFIEDEIPTHIPSYYKLKAALARYRRIEDAGGWPSIPENQVLKLGMQDEHVELLRQRLAATGDMGAGEPDDTQRFDEQTKQAVKRFQQRHGLAADGVVGKDTLAALNVPVKARINQIRVNLERARWVFQDITTADDYIIVDIAGFHVHLIRDGKKAWDTRAQVGKPYRKTPVFKSTMKYLEFNPTWTVPPGILAKDILPRVKRDPDYLRQKNIKVIDRNGKAIGSDTLDWSKYTARNFPYQLRQDPGPQNALGRVKFMFPNPHLVYLHDTPSKALFQRTERAFSSGCIRIENPFKLAELLLDDTTKWNQESIRNVIDSTRTQRVNLPKPLTVMLLYWTVDVDDEGIVHFKRDFYGRDQKILKGLEGDFVFSPPQGMPQWFRNKEM